MNIPGYFEFVSGIVQAEVAARQQRRTEYLVNNNRLPQPLNMLSVFDFQPMLDRRLVVDLVSLGFIERHQSILFVGDHGTGKSHIWRFLALRACQRGYKTYYTTCSERINDLNAGVYEKTLDKRIRKYISPELLL